MSGQKKTLTQPPLGCYADKIVTRWRKKVVGWVVKFRKANFDNFQNWAEPKQYRKCAFNGVMNDFHR